MITMKKNYLTHSLKNLSISQELSLQINKYLMKLNKLRFKKFQIKNKNKLKNHFYIIVAPYTIHLLEPCLRLASS